ncbi:uncharacterized protein CPUR_00740 [Claviceps purpurea 20.1]|uniref:RNase H type-1 domain-containing protein n=1 Tax=Claviceps purpurea (strain 20.1) TaxID=1111077 RepID=M1W5H0_CLAP2|nr:uncharacterized protein CPUR_00740 [Claviceps purpurea 20.1]
MFPAVQTHPDWCPQDTPRTGITGMVEKMEKAVRTAARAMLPVWKTTPIPILHRESGLLPAYQMLEHIRRRVRRPTRLQRAWTLLPTAERPLLRTKGEPPWESPETGTKEVEAKAFEAYLLTIPPTGFLSYTDGSLLDNGVAGWSLSIRHPLRISLKLRVCGRLDRVEVFDAEAYGALYGLHICLALRAEPSHCICVFPDNQSVVNRLLGRPADSSQKVFLTFQQLAKGNNVRVRWAPGHTGVQGNEEADEMAKRGAARTEVSTNPPTLAWVERRAREITAGVYDQWAVDNLPSLYQMSGLEVTLGAPSELSVPRPSLRHLIAARTGHGDFDLYHERLDHDDAFLLCTCGRRKHQLHIFYCRNIPPTLRLHLGPDAGAAIARAIGPRGYKKFIELVEQTSFFETICSRYGGLPSSSNAH